MDPLQKIPLEIWSEICFELNPFDAQKLFLTCKKLYSLRQEYLKYISNICNKTPSKVIKFCQKIYKKSPFDGAVNKVFSVYCAKRKIRDEWKVFKRITPEYDRDGFQTIQEAKEWCLTMGVGDKRSESCCTFSLERLGLHYLTFEISKLSFHILLLNKNKLKDLPEFYENTPIKVLECQSNKLTKVPTAIFALRMLTKLKLGCNQIEQLPSEIYNLTQLVVLHLNDNRLKTLGVGIAKLQNLEDINIRDNLIENLSDELSKCKKIIKFDFRNNFFNPLIISRFSFASGLLYRE